MGRARRLYACSGCGQLSGQWTGRCPACGGWGTVTERPGAEPERGGAYGQALRPPRVAALAHGGEERRILTGLPGVDRVLGGGLVAGSAVLLAGAPGIGKSTLLLQLASRLSDAGHSCLLASGEESRGQVAARALRLGLDCERIRFVPGRDLPEVLAAIEAERPEVVVLDSIQAIRDPSSTLLPGGLGQVRGCADALISAAKEHGVAIVLVGHVTKDGEVAGPRTLEHAVDAVLTFEGDVRSGLRVLAGGKNRFGPEGEVAWFEMGGGGLAEVDARPRFLGRLPEPGAAVALALAGRRSFAVEVQALVVPTPAAPRRQVAGLDSRRFHIVAAVTEQVARVGLTRAEVFGTTAGGIRLDDPGADLAVAAALLSAAVGSPAPQGWGFVGELSLTGAVRPVAGVEQRLAAARAAGMRRVAIPAACAPEAPSPDGPELAPVAHLRDALAWAQGGGPVPGPTETRADQRF